MQPRHQELYQQKQNAQTALQAAREDLQRATAFETQSLTNAKRTHAALQAAKAEDIQEKPLDLSAEEDIAEVKTDNDHKYQDVDP
ncbi:hypothetical protein FRB91_010969 [Serendipita sp. 411]|nr:hypothetical protein FRB91_010969 [Serendipita sp. 411]